MKVDRLGDVFGHAAKSAVRTQFVPGQFGQPAVAGVLLGPEGAATGPVPLGPPLGREFRVVLGRAAVLSETSGQPRGAGSGQQATEGSTVDQGNRGRPHPWDFRFSP